MSDIEKTDQEWLEQLGPDGYRICRQQGTEPAFSGVYWDCKKPGQYLCRCCGELLFDSETKYDSGSGWPSFWQPANDKVIREISDLSHGMRRIEVRCQRCDSHLGHVFEDGPAPTGLRYCINSASLTLQEKQG